MDLLEAINNRRSIRNYKSDPVPDELVNQILETVRMSPSWANTQCWEFVIVKDPEVRGKIRATVFEKNPALKAFDAAPITVVVLAKKNESGYYKGAASTNKGDWAMFDIGLAMQTFCLTAHSLGLGTVMVGVFNHDEVAKILGVPDNVEVMVLTPLGYVEKPSKTPKRKEFSEFTYYDKYGKTS